MKVLLIRIFKLTLKVIYCFLKLFKTDKNKVTFISRQSDSPSVDFDLIINSIKQKNKNIKVKTICKRMRKGLGNMIGYYFHLIYQMYHIATSKVCVIDSYNIPICILKHKKDLYVIQIWHSIGKIKKSGYQTVGKAAGRSLTLANEMCMHKNYDVIIAGGEYFNKFYEEGFNVSKDKLFNYGLPRIDYLIKTEQKRKEEILKKYPEFKEKKVILYVPTFRRYEIETLKLFEQYDKESCILILKPHPNQDIKADKDIYLCNEFSSIDLLSVADYVITDYSSICLEAAVLDKKVLFYLYDYEKYMSSNGVNFDPLKELPTCSFKEIDGLLDVIDNDSYDIESYEKFRKKCLPNKLGTSTEQITNLIIEKIG